MPTANDLERSFLTQALGASALATDTINDLRAKFYTGRSVGFFRGNTFIAIGDSISATEEQSAAGAGYGGSWPQMACAYSGQRLSYVANAGVAGETSTQILARLSNIISTYKPAVMSILAGTNDLTNSVSFATWSGNIKSMVLAMRAANVRPVLCTIPPRGNTTYMATQQVWNAWLRKFANDNSIDLVDFFNVLADPVTGMYKAGYNSGDGLHPHQTAHIAMAQAFNSQISPLLPVNSPILAKSAVDSANLIANPLLSAGSPTPTSWTATGSASADFVEQLVTDTDFDGKAWEVAYTNAVSAANFRELVSANIAPAAGWSVGDTMLATCKGKVVSNAGLTPSTTVGWRFRVLRLGGTPQYYNPVASLAVPSPVGTHAYMFVVPPGTTALALSNILGTINVAGSFTARVGNFGLYNLSTLGSTAL